MSRVKFEDYFAEPQGLGMFDPFGQLTEELNGMDFNLENPGLMSSEFFDSVLSLEEQTASFGNDIGFNNISSCSKFALSNDQEELRLNYNGSPDSATSSYSCEIPDVIPTSNTRMDFERNGKVILMKKPVQNASKIFGSPNQGPGKLILNNPNGKKVIVTKPHAGKNNRRNAANAKHIFKVQSISGKGKTLLLPFNVAQMKNIKIINGKGLSAENLHITGSAGVSLLKFEDNYSISSPDSIDDDSDSLDTKCSRQYPVLVLTEEEKRLLSKEGIRLPTHYPLTKSEEKELKRIRRKIRNKISAQDSRKRKKEYIDGLEERLKQSTEEKKILMNRVKVLQQQNNRLVSQMHKLQSMVFNTSKATPTTCLLIVLMSALLVSLPNLNITKGTSVNDEQQVIARRTLLSSHRATNEDAGSLDEFLLFNANQKPKITAFEEEGTSEEQDAPPCLHYDECEISSKKLLETEDIINDVRNTIDKMKKFFKNHLDIGNNFNEGRIIEKHEISKNFPKRVRLCSEIYDDCMPAKISKIEEHKTEDYIANELNSGRDAPSSVALHLGNRE